MAYIRDYLKAIEVVGWII